MEFQSGPVELQVIDSITRFEGLKHEIDDLLGQTERDLGPSFNFTQSVSPRRGFGVHFCMSASGPFTTTSFGCLRHLMESGTRAWSAAMFRSPCDFRF